MKPIPQNQDMTRHLLDVLIKAGLITVLALTCYEIFRPFLSLMLWGLILGVTLYPLHCRLREQLGLRDGSIAVMIVSVALMLLMVPIYLLGVSIVESAHGALEMMKSGDWHIPRPNPSVSAWPLVGTPLYDFWQQASVDLTSLVKQQLPHLQTVGMTLLGTAAGVGAGFLLFLAAVIVAGFSWHMAKAANATPCKSQLGFQDPNEGPRSPGYAPQPSGPSLKGSLGLPLSRCFWWASASC